MSGASIFNPRDKSRTSAGKTYNLVRKHTRPPDDQNGWAWLTRDFMESIALRSLSANARKALDRLLIEHVSHGATQNGNLTVPHAQFATYGVTKSYVGDALDELAFKGIIRINRGRAGAGTAHASTFRLTFTGDYEGAAATNEWKRCTDDRVAEWETKARSVMAEKRAKVGRKKKTSVHDSGIRPVHDSGIRRVARP